MKAAELISDLRGLGSSDLCMLFMYLADHVYEARLRGGRLNDVMDFKEWLEELAEAARK